MTTDANDHDVLREQVALYAVGALDGPERAAVESHLRQCDACTADLASFRQVGGALAQAVPQHDPPLLARARVLAAATGRPERMRALPALVPWLAAAAMLVVTAVLGLYVAQLRERVRSLERQLGEAILRVNEGERRVNVMLRASADLERRFDVMSAPDVRRIELAGQPAAPSASARVFWSRSRGLVFTGSNLPKLPAGRIYQLWFVTTDAPVSAGLLNTDDSGRPIVLGTSPDIPNPIALAVTLEPEGGVPAPTGDKYLVGATQ
jgi:anti-sigma-K factor RskA